VFRLEKKSIKPADTVRPQERPLMERLGDRREWFGLALMFAALEIVVLSMERAHWITPQPSLTLMLILAVLTVRILTVTRLHWTVIHLITLGLGAGVTFWQVYGSLSHRNTFYFAVFLAFLTWLMGYLSAWFFLRTKNAWVAVILGVLVILVNLSNLPGGYFWYFGLFFIAAVLLIVQTRLARGRSPAEEGARQSGRGVLYFVSALLCIVMLAAFVSWAVPAVRIPAFQTMIASKISWKNIFESSEFNIFAEVPSKQSISTNNMRLTLPFEASWHRGDRVDFVVKAEKPSYWQVRTYDIYTASGWENSPVEDFDLKSKTTWEGAAPPAKADAETYTVTPGILTDVLLISGSFISTNKPVMVQVSAGDVIGVMASRVLSEGESYTVTAAIAPATPRDLDRAGEDYPESILQNYLQLPPDFPRSVRQLSANITANATTPYQKVLKINEYLSKIPYKTDLTIPPPGRDGVEYFLFDLESGFCVHFASAMATMLRAEGVPVRLAIGYLPGDPGAEAGQYILKDKYYHAWPQVYFPGYGWVDIEATPSGEESTGSEVDLSEPVVSSDVIGQLPQWDVWAAMYGFPGINGGAGAGGGGDGGAIAGSGSTPNPFSHWAFADELGWALFIVVLIALFAVVLLILWLPLRSSFDRWIWRVDRSELASTTYKKLCQLGSMVKISPRLQQTPQEYAAVLAAEFPEQSEELQEIARAFMERRFGGREGKLDIFNEARILKARRRLFGRIMGRLNQVEKIFRGRL
jgi:transglutaminase-like putative cysteine protease